MTGDAFQALYHPFVLCFRAEGDAECREIQRYGHEMTVDGISQAGQDYARVAGKGPGTIEFWRDGETEARHIEPWQ